MKPPFHLTLLATGCVALWVALPSGFGQTSIANRATPDPFHVGPSRLLTAVAFGDGIFVAVGFHRLILTSPDGTNWSEQSLASEISTIGINFTAETYVAGGQSLTLAVPSAGAAQAEVRPNPFQFRAVGFGNGEFVIVGDSGEIHVSPDGKHWRLSGAPTAASLNGIVYGGGKFVAVGDSGTILSSPDAIHWTQQISGASNQLRAVAYGNHIFTAVGGDMDNSVILTSADGVHWMANKRNRQGPIGAITFGNGQFLASAGCSYLLTLMSADGQHWREIQHPSSAVRALAFGGNQFVAVDATAQPTVSPDGRDWQPPFAQRKFGFDFYDAAYGNGNYVLVGRGALNISPDGIHWQRIQLPPSRLLCGRIIGNRIFRPDFDATTRLMWSPGVLPVLHLFSQDGQTWHTERRRPTSGNVVDGETRFLKPLKSGEYAVLYSEDGVTWTRLRSKPAATAIMVTNSNAPSASPISSVRIAFQVNGQFYNLPNVSARAGQTYQLQASTDLEHWQTLATFTISENGFSFTDPDAAKYPRRFYRLKLQP